MYMNYILFMLRLEIFYYRKIVEEDVWVIE